MKKRVINTIIVILFLGTILSFLEYNEYIKRNSVLDIVEIEIERIDELQSLKEPYAIYVGRPSCPFCRIFSDKLYKIRESYIPIYYLNSITNYDESPIKIKEFRDKNNINIVPCFKVFCEDKIIGELKITETITTDDIEKFLINFK